MHELARCRRDTNAGSSARAAAGSHSGSQNAHRPFTERGAGFCERLDAEREPPSARVELGEPSSDPGESEGGVRIGLRASEENTPDIR
jgi:hypothetical protein